MTSTNEPPARTVQLIERAKHGDAAAQSALFARYVPRVRGLVAVRMGERLARLVEHDDIVMTVMAEAFAGLDDFEMRSESSFIRWLGALVENRLRDAARRAGAARRGGAAERRFADLGRTTLAGADPAHSDSPSRAAVRREEQAALEEAMLALSDRYRLVLFHRLVLGLELDEIATEMGLENAATARALLHKAARRLRQELPDA